MENNRQVRCIYPQRGHMCRSGIIYICLDQMHIIHMPVQVCIQMQEECYVEEERCRIHGKCAAEFAPPA